MRDLTHSFGKPVHVGSGIADTPTDVLGKLEPGLAYCATDRAYAITALRMAFGLCRANSLAYQGRIVP
jgi:hypothetical protein